MKQPLQLALLLITFSYSIDFKENLAAAASDRLFCTKKYAQFFDLYPKKILYKFPLKVGIEIEGSIPKQIDLKGIVENLHQTLRKTYPRVIIRKISNLEEYFLVYRNHSDQEKIYQIHTDHSIITSQTPFEIASPILTEPEDFIIFHEVIENLKKIGARSEPASAGVHIHIDFSNPHFGEVSSLAAIFAEIEEDLMMRFSTLETRKIYTRPTAEMILQFLDQANLSEFPDEYESIFWKIVEQQSRYHALNFKSYSRHGTVEFRLFNSTLNIQALQIIEDFAIKLVSALRNKNPALVEYLVQNEGLIQLEEIAKILDMKLAQPEAKTVLDQVLREAQSVKTQLKIKNLKIFESFSQVALLIAAAAMIHEVIEKMEPTLRPEKTRTVEGASN